MTMNKKILFKTVFVLSIVMIICILSIAFVKAIEFETSGELEEGNISWTFDEPSGILYIDGDGYMPNFITDYEQYAPWYDFRDKIMHVVIGDQISAIGEDSFYDCQNLQSVHIGNSVVEILNYAFYNCKSLKEVTIPDSVTYIYGAAFLDCSSLESVTLSDNLYYIGPGAFRGCSSLKNIELPESLTLIEQEAFEYCESLESISIPGSVINIPTFAFAYCSGLNRVEIGEGTNVIGVGAFGACGTLQSLTVPSTLTDIEDYAFLETEVTKIYISDLAAWIGVNATVSSYIKPFSCELYLNGALYTVSGEVVIPDGVTTIRDFCFDRCTEITSIKIPESVTYIGAGAFSECTALENIDIPDSVTYIGRAAFQLCDSLTSITIPDNAVISDSSHMFDCCTSLTSVVLGKGVANIGDYAFRDCTALASISIRGEIEAIGQSAFWGCDSLKSFNVPASVTSIGDEAFVSSGLVDIDFEEGSQLKSLGHRAFASQYLTSIVIPDGVTTPIYDQMFYGCDALTSVTLGENIPYIGKRAFDRCGALKSINIPSSVTSIGERAFYDCQVLETVTIEEDSQLTSIGSHAFFYCYALEEIYIPQNVKSIGEDAFFDCNSLKDVYVADIYNWCLINFANISSNPMYYAENVYVDGEILTSIAVCSDQAHIEDDLPYISNYAFAGCSSLESVIILSDTSSIGDYAFAGCSSLERVILPWALRSIGEYAFSQCSLQSVSFAENCLLTTIGASAFSACKSLTSIDLPSGVTSIGENVFSGCGFTFLNLPDNLTYIGAGAFKSCKSLKYIVIPEGVETIYENTFYNCSSLLCVVIPKNIEIDSAFSSCPELEHIIYPGTPEEAELLVNILGSDKNIFKNVTWCYATEVKEPSLFDSCSWNGLKCNVCNHALISEIKREPTHEYVDGICTICQHNADFEYEITEDYLTDSGYYVVIKKYNGSSTDVVIPDFIEFIKVTTIGNLAFSDCTSITSITIPKSIEKMCFRAFFGCTSLRDVYITDLDRWCHIDFELDIDMFSNPMYYAKNIYLNGGLITSVVIPEDITEINAIFMGFSQVTEIHIPENITLIGQSAFSGCSSLVTIHIPDSVTRIETSAFSGCSSLVSINIPDSVTEICDNTFSNCTSLANINIPNGVTRIGGYAFAWCSSLVSINIPDSVTDFGYWAFAKCSSLERVYISDIVSWLNISYDSDEYAACNPLCNNATLYLNGEPIKTLVIPEGINSIPSYAFANCTSLESLILPESVVSIGNSAFRNCFELNSINIPSAVTFIGEHAFSDCSSLSSVCIPSGITEIKNNTFYNCSSLSNVVLPDTLISINMYAFYGCSSLANIVFPDGLTRIGLYAFEFSGLTSVLIPDSLTNLDFGAFDHTEYLEYIRFLGDAPTVEYMYVSDTKHSVTIYYPKDNDTYTDQFKSVWNPGYLVTFLYWCDHILNDAVIENEKEVSCTENGGYDSVVYCSLCSREISREIIVITEKFGHDYSEEWIIDVEGDCVTATVKSHHCSRCDDRIDIIEIPATGHSFDGQHSYREEPTCVYQGYYETTVYCSKCFMVLGRECEWPAALGHDYSSEWTIDIVPTCTERGSKSHHCTRCDDKIDITQMPTAEHTLGEWHQTLAPTCTQSGIAESICSVCNTSEIKLVAAIGHIATDAVIEEYRAPTCYLEGFCYSVIYCSECRMKLEYDYITFEMIDHIAADSVVINVVVPDCVTNGYYDSVVYCSVCMRELSCERKVTDRLGHDYSAEWTVDIAPTCTLVGSRSHHCSRCDEKQDVTELPATGHAFGEWYETLAPTCTTVGTNERACEVCYHRETETVQAAGHKGATPIEEILAYPTCTSYGIGWSVVYCSVCSAEIERDNRIIPALGHDYSTEWTVEMSPTCTNSGIKSHRCLYCGAPSDFTEEIPATGHAFGEWYEILAPTCTTVGTNERACEVCYHRESETVQAAGHKGAAPIEEILTHPTCTSYGIGGIVVYCSVCSAEVERDNRIIPALGHDYSTEWTVDEAPTCTVSGRKSHHCSRCSKTSDVTTIAALGHTWGEWCETVAPTCTATGSDEHECSVCYEKETRTVSALGHTNASAVEENRVDATCTDTGRYNRVVYCSVCEALLSREEITIDPLGHDHSEEWTVDVEPTCTEEGSKSHHCIRCTDKADVTTIAALGHAWGEWCEKVAPTCTENGTDERECSVCHDKETRTVSALGHTNASAVEENRVNATCTESGSYDSVVYCSVCEAELLREEITINALGHNHSEEWTVDVEPTCTEEGSKSHHCTRCTDKADVTVIEPKGHIFDDELDNSCNACDYFKPVVTTSTTTDTTSELQTTTENTAAGGCTSSIANAYGFVAMLTLVFFAFSIKKKIED